MDLIPLFENSKRIEAERRSHEVKKQKSPYRIQLFPEGTSLGNQKSQEGNWLPQDSNGKQWNSRIGKWVER
jgi:hypothetical protein